MSRLLVIIAFLFACQKSEQPAAPKTPKPAVPQESTPKTSTVSPSADGRHGLLQKNLPMATQALLRNRMHRHVEDMNELLWSVLNLELEAVASIASKLQKDPIVKVSKDSRLAPFSGLSAELSSRAKVLEDAAKADNPNEVAVAFGKVTETCVRCHAAVSEDPEQRTP